MPPLSKKKAAAQQIHEQPGIPLPAEAIVLVGGGDHGRGVLDILHRLNRDGVDTTCLGFVDDELRGNSIHNMPLLGDSKWLADNLTALGASVLLSVASPESKRRLAALLDSAGARYARVVHPSAEVSPSSELGPGTIINAGAVVAYEARIGAHVTINLTATVGHQVIVGDFSTIAPGANVLGRARIGEACEIHSNSVILPSISIGDRAVVGAGSVVLEDVPVASTVFGNPARPVPVSR